MGDNSPAVTATMASSSSSRPPRSAPAEQGAALLVEGQRAQVGIAETLTNLGGSHCGVVRNVVVTSGPELQHGRQQQVAPLGTVLQ